MPLASGFMQLVPVATGQRLNILHVHCLFKKKCYRCIDIQNFHFGRYIYGRFQCIHLCFCMLAISFYFVNCVIISCKLSFNSRFTRNQILTMSFLRFKKAELGIKMSELHLYVVKRQNCVVIIRK